MNNEVDAMVCHNHQWIHTFIFSLPSAWSTLGLISSPSKHTHTLNIVIKSREKRFEKMRVLMDFVHFAIHLNLPMLNSLYSLEIHIKCTNKPKKTLVTRKMLSEFVNIGHNTCYKIMICIRQQYHLFIIIKLI